MLGVTATLVMGTAACGGSDDDGEGDAAPMTPVVTTPATEPAAATAPTTAPPTAPPTAPSTTPPTAPSTSAPAPTTVAAAPWEPAGFGEYEVGVATVTVDDPAGERPLTVDVWFPIADGADATEPEQYTFLPNVYYESPNAFAATADAIAAGPFPLIVYSHGSGALRYIHSAYTEALASHGYVVVSADHTGNTSFERIAGGDTPVEETAYNRPSDVRRLIDAFVDPAHPTAGAYAAQVDPEDIAVTGHSFGGFTSIAVATGFANEVGELAPDDRVDAIIPIAPATGPTLLTDDLLASIDVPMMVIVGTDDITTPVDPNVTRLWDLSTVSPAYRVELVAGEHETFTDVCAYQDEVPLREGVPQVVIDLIDQFALEGCQEGDIAPDRANELTVTYVLQFLDEVFAGGDPITTAAPDDVIFQSR